MVGYEVFWAQTRFEFTPILDDNFSKFWNKIRKCTGWDSNSRSNWQNIVYRVVQNYWYCEGKYGCGVCLTPPKSYMSFFFHKNNIFQHFTSRKFPKYCAKFWKIMSVNWIILHPYFRNDNFSKNRNYSFLIEILFTKLS